jgi:mRNA deadenylase 3'-5' endonuclease subunit Ccr4
MFTCAIMYRYLQVVQQIRAAEDKDDISSQGDEQIFTPQVSKLRSLNI